MRIAYPAQGNKQTTGNEKIDETLDAGCHPDTLQPHGVHVMFQG